MEFCEASSLEFCEASSLEFCEAPSDEFDDRATEDFPEDWDDPRPEDWDDPRPDDWEDKSPSGGENSLVECRDDETFCEGSSTMTCVFLFVFLLSWTVWVELINFFTRKYFVFNHIS